MRTPGIISPRLNARNAVSVIVWELPPAIIFVSDAAAPCIASVTMNGAIFTLATSTPLMSPHTMPTPSATSTPAAMLCVSSITSTPHMPEREYIEPTDRSMPPVMTTTSCPIVMISSGADDCKTLRRLPFFSAVPVTMCSTRYSTISITVMPASSL